MHAQLEVGEVIDMLIALTFKGTEARRLDVVSVH